MQTIYTSQRGLRCHTTRCHTKTRNKLNLTLVSDLLPTSDPHQWKAALSWLQNHHLLPARQDHNIWRSLNYHARSEFLATYDTPRHDASHLHPSYQTTPAPFWTLLFLLHAPLLQPPHGDEPTAFHDLLSLRLCLVQQGHIQQLYEEAQSIPLKARVISPPTFASKTDPCPEA
jgi:hypothetical protein